MINSEFDPNGISNPNYNIFGIPVTEEDARIVYITGSVGSDGK